MLSKMFPDEKFDSSGVPNESSGVQGWEGANIDSFFSSTGLFQEQPDAAELGAAMSEKEIQQQLQDYEELGNFDDLYLDVVSPPFQSCDDDIKKIFGIDCSDFEQIEAKEKGSHAFPVASSEILRKLDGKKRKAHHQMQATDSRGSMISTGKIIGSAVEKFIESIAESKDISTISHPYPSSVLGHDSREVQLVQNLLLAAKTVGDKKYKCGRKLLEECDRMSSCTGTLIQRLLFYCTEALHEKIDRETGTITSSALGKEFFDPMEALKCRNTFLVALNEKHPLCRISKFSGTQAVLDHVAEARKVHLIDFEICIGAHCIILMQALSTRLENPIQHIKITAIGTKSKPTLEETGRRLMAFAESVNLKLSFHIVILTDILELNENLFELDADEAVAVYAAYTLRNMIGSANQLEHVMKVIKKISPSILIFAEIEENYNSPSFLWRFVESLFFFGALFDSFAECMKDDEEIRREAESTCRSSIRKVMAEGDERLVWQGSNLNFWRAFFARFGLVEIELSMSSVYQANLLRQSSPCGSSCTLGMNGKCLVLGWKGTPLSTLSAWKF